MKHRRFKTQTVKQANSANTQHHLLHETRFPIAPVQMTCYQSIDWLVFRNVRVEQIKLHATNIGAPDSRMHNPAAHADLNQQRLTLLVIETLQREFIDVVLSILLLLPIVTSHALTKVTEAIKQTDGHEREIQITR